MMVKDRLHRGTEKERRQSFMQKELQLLGCKICQEASQSGVPPGTLRNSVLKKPWIPNGERAHRQHRMESGAEVPDVDLGKPAPLRHAGQRHAETRARIPKAAKPC